MPRSILRQGTQEPQPPRSQFSVCARRSAAVRFPIERGYALSADDLIRRTVITELMCNFHVDRGRVEARFGIDFQSYFAGELAALSDTNGPVADGFLTIGGDGLDVTPRGRLFVRNICMAFDRYLPAHEGKPVFSRTI